MCRKLDHSFHFYYDVVLRGSRMWPLLQEWKDKETVRENKLLLVTIMENIAVYKNGQKDGLVTKADFDWIECNEAIFWIWRHSHKYFHIYTMCLCVLIIIINNLCFQIVKEEKICSHDPDSSWMLLVGSIKPSHWHHYIGMGSIFLFILPHSITNP